LKLPAKFEKKMPVLGWEKTITCPYNPSHQITVERIQFHLVKCRKNHAGSDLKVCPFNASHHVPAPEEAFHMKTCSDRKVVEMEKYSWSMQQPRQHGNLKLPVREELPPSEEDWESEATVTRSYDPRAKAEKMQVLRKIEGATPSERKEFRAMEKHRHEVLNEEKKKRGSASMTQDPFNDKESIPSRTSNRSSQQRVEKEAGGPLRRPTLMPGRQEENEEPRGVRDSILAAHLGRGRGLPASSSKSQQLRRPGSFMQPPSLDTTGLDSTFESGRNTLDTRDTRNMSVDTLDMAINAVGKLSLGRGRQNPAGGWKQDEQDGTLRKPTVVQSRPGPTL